MGIWKLTDITYNLNKAMKFVLYIYQRDSYINSFLSMT